MFIMLRQLSDVRPLHPFPSHIQIAIGQFLFQQFVLIRVTFRGAVEGDVFQFLEIGQGSQVLDSITPSQGKKTPTLAARRAARGP
jgi:hypothetical protein